MIYTYACKNAIHTSKQVINKIKNNGNQKVPDKKTQVPIIPHKKEINRRQFIRAPLFKFIPNNILTKNESSQLQCKF